VCVISSAAKHQQKSAYDVIRGTLPAGQSEGEKEMSLVVGVPANELCGE